MNLILYLNLITFLNLKTLQFCFYIFIYLLQIYLK